MNKKIFFFDIDGTLTDDRTHQIVPSAKVAIQKLKQAGHFVAIASGRFHYKTVGIARQLGIDHFVCSGGGCLVLNNQIVQNEPLDQDKAHEFIRKAKEYGMGYLLLREDNDGVDMVDFRFLEQAGFRKELTSYHYRPDLEVDSLQDIYKIYLAIREDQEKEYPFIQLLGHMRMTKDYIVVQHDKKNEGIQNLLTLIHRDSKDVVVFGDGTNDLVMFQKEYFKVAMGNGSEKLKKKADYVCEASYDDGIYQTCEHFGWFQVEENQDERD